MWESGIMRLPRTGTAFPLNMQETHSLATNTAGCYSFLCIGKKPDEFPNFQLPLKSQAYFSSVLVSDPLSHPSHPSLPPVKGLTFWF